MRDESEKPSGSSFILHPSSFQTTSPYVSMLFGSFSFAMMATLANALRSTYDWQVIALARTLLAMIFAAILALAAGKRLVFWKPRILWIRSMAGSVSLVCTFFALTRLPVGEVLTLTNMFPIWVALIAWPLLNQPLTGQIWLSVLMSVFGVVLIQQPHFAEGNFASLAALVSSVFTAIAMLGLNRLSGIDARAIVVHFSAVSLVFCVVSLFLFEHSGPGPAVLEGGPMLMLLGVGLTATIGQLFLTKAFVTGPPAKVAIVGLSQVVFALVFDLILGHQPMSPVTMAGVVLVLTPTAWVMAGRSS